MKCNVQRNYFSYNSKNAFSAIISSVVHIRNGIYTKLIAFQSNFYYQMLIHGDLCVKILVNILCLFQNVISPSSLAISAKGWLQKFVNVGIYIISIHKVRPFIWDPLWKIWCLYRENIQFFIFFESFIFWIFCVLICRSTINFFIRPYLAFNEQFLMNWWLL